MKPLSLEKWRYFFQKYNEFEMICKGTMFIKLFPRCAILSRVSWGPLFEARFSLFRLAFSFRAVTQALKSEQV